MSELKVQEPPICPHCGEMMSVFTLPPVTFGDGLGWNAPFLWICGNDECPVFRKGFEQALSQYGRTVSMRAIVEPDSGRHSVAPAFSFDPAHMGKFLEERAKRAADATKSTPDDDEDWPDENDYDPNKGFAGS
jgi:hypothetical protein